MTPRTAAEADAGGLGEILRAGAFAPAFSLRDTPHSRVALDELRGRSVVLVFHVADWHPVSSDQLVGVTEALPLFDRLGATVLAVSTDSSWSHAWFTRMADLRIPLLADDEPLGAVARAYGVLAPETGRSRRALFVIDASGVVRWSATFPAIIVAANAQLLRGLRLRPAGASS